MKQKILLSAFVIATAWAPNASAGIITYFDKSAFLSATGATSATGPLPDRGVVDYGPIAIGSITFAPVSGSALEFGDIQSNYPGGWTTRLPGNDLGIADIESFNATLSGPSFSFGFDFVEPEFDPNVGAPFVDSTFTVTLLSAATPIGSFTYNAPNDIAWFVGVASDTAFDSVQIRETTGGIENEFFGQFYTTPVPEPSTFIYGFFGFACFITRRFRIQTNA